jgi:hypothetical protein
MNRIVVLADCCVSQGRTCPRHRHLSPDVSCRAFINAPPRILPLSSARASRRGCVPTPTASACSAGTGLCDGARVPSIVVYTGRRRCTGATDGPDGIGRSQQRRDDAYARAPALVFCTWSPVLLVVWCTVLARCSTYVLASSPCHILHISLINCVHTTVTCLVGR